MSNYASLCVLTCFIWIKQLPDGVVNEAEDLRVIQTDVDRWELTHAALADLAMNQSRLEVLAGVWKSSGDPIPGGILNKSAILLLLAKLELLNVPKLRLQLLLFGF